MPAIGVVRRFGSNPSFNCVIESADKLEKFPQIRTFFTNYRNPIGIEVEVEGVKGPGKKEWLLWKPHSDGSLKIDGMEYISLPVSGQQVDYALWELEQYFSKQKSPLLWSHRTSIHVHQNMSTMTCEQLKAYIMAYGLFEDLFFSLCAPEREGNPYCYRATEVEVEKFMHVHEYNKYCELNLFPLKVQSTVEWRHMHGHQDFRLLRRWVQLIMKLHNWANNLDNDSAVQHVSDTILAGAFASLAKTIFGASTALFTEDQIIRSGRRNALWSIQISEKEFA
jgi:hypothetical protein